MDVIMVAAAICGIVDFAINMAKSIKQFVREKKMNNLTSNDRICHLVLPTMTHSVILSASSTHQPCDCRS